MLAHRIKAALRQGQAVVGSWMSLGDTGVAEVMAGAGFDFLTVDLEHSAITLQQAQELIRVVSLSGVCPLARLSSNDPTQIKRVLDLGAAGIIVPMVNSEAEAQAAVAACKYPPMGRRSVGLSRAQGYGPGFDAYFSAANDDTLVVVQIEHAEAVERAEAILSVPGIDAYLIGPYDLSASLGLAGQLDHPHVVEAVARVRAVARRLGVPAGFHLVAPDSERLVRLINDGYQLVAYSVDFMLLGETCRRDLAAIRQQLPTEDRS
jgi:2-keto-3-deoxy-L-rhamnonate aldolase RhmA